MFIRTGVALLSLVAVASLLTGCAGVVPLPTTSSTPEWGRRITREQVAFIRPGQTTGAEIVEKLGADYTALPLGRALAYTWELPGGGGVWWVVAVIPCPAGGGAVADAGKWEGGWRGFLVAFDENGVVSATAFKKLSTRKSLHENMDRWIARLPARPPPPSPPGLPQPLRSPAQELLANGGARTD